MAGKRKRSRVGQHDMAYKRLKLGDRGPNDEVVKRFLLSHYYSEVMTLREYLLSKLSLSSKARRKKIASLGIAHRPERGTQPEDEESVGEAFIGNYLDKTLVGVLETKSLSRDERMKDWTCFSQLADKTESGIGGTVSDGGYCQSEIVDFAVWSLFTKSDKLNSRVQHLLGQGFRKIISSYSINNGANPTSAIPGVVSAYPNHLVTAIKGPPWPQILGLLGKEGEKVMIDLLLDCGIFHAVESGRGNYFQLSGKPLGDLQVLKSKCEGTKVMSNRAVASGGAAARLANKELTPWPLNSEQTAKRVAALPEDGRMSLAKLKNPKSNRVNETQRVEAGPANNTGGIVFVRNRILYARAELNAKGSVRFGLRHIHVLNRFVYKHDQTKSKQAKENAGKNVEDEDKRRAIHVMMYIFPRQFGLHNVFTSKVDARETAQPFKDYTLREDEIRSKFGANGKSSVPKRLRGEAQELVKKLQILHRRCSYSELLRHYCPVLEKRTVANLQSSVISESTAFESQATASVQRVSALASLPPAIGLPHRQPSLMDHATPTADVSAFCRTVLSNLIPDRFWGTKQAQDHNKRVFMGDVDRFIKMRRFESLSLHEAIHGIKLQDMPWLAPHNDVSAKMSQSDHQKRLELLSEFVYYMFDSILIPLIRTNFHVTESNGNRSRLFFFRHDVWRSLSEPAMLSLKSKMFEELDPEEAQNVLQSRGFGFSHIRLLPKGTGVRPIMNLKRRAVKKGFKTTLGPSINSVLGPVFNMLTFEKKMDPRRLGSSLFSVGDLYKKLKAFKSSLPKEKQLFFVKADVQAAFDTIPQSAVMRLMSELPGESEYRISKHVEIKPDGGKPVRKWTSRAVPLGDFDTFHQNLESELAVGKRNTVFVESVVGQFRRKDELLALLAEHIQCNMVKMGKKFYRQKEGIPQGSVVSSLLCNYFYADLELQHLSFLTGESLLLRLIDDFLLITTNQEHAKTFLKVMHGGLPEYGVVVNPDKTLTNFEVSLSGKKIARLVGSRHFPYCGSFIDTKTLNITKDRKGLIADSLTVEFSRVPGNAFHRKVLSTFKIQAHAMFLDTSFNSVETVLSNLYEGFQETATKMWTYVKCLPPHKQPGATLVIRTIGSLVELAAILLKSKRRNHDGYKCAVSKVQIEWLVVTAFHRVLMRRQSKYGVVMVWLKRRIELTKSKQTKTRQSMEITGLEGEWRTS